MKFSSIKISTRSQKILGDMKARTGITPNILARFAICMSLKDPSMPNPSEFNKDGSELTLDVLFGVHQPVYQALMANRLKQDKLDLGIYLADMIRAHLNRGVIALGPRINHLSDFYELVKEERNV